MAKVIPPRPEPEQLWLEIVIPARNEAARLPAGLALLCEKAATYPFSVGILVVDSASSDGTAQIVSGWPDGPVPVRLLRCERGGKGAAVRAGLLATRAPLVGFCDADMATDLSALDVAVSLLTSGHSMVIGSRSHSESVVENRHSAVRRSGAAVFRMLARTIAPTVADSQCGFKFFAGPSVRRAALVLTATGFAFDLELIARCQRLGAEPTEIPVRWRDAPGSTFSVLRHSPGICLEVASIWFTLRAADRQRRAAPAGAPFPLPAAAADHQPASFAELGGNEPVALP